MASAWWEAPRAWSRVAAVGHCRPASDFAEIKIEYPILEILSSESARFVTDHFHVAPLLTYAFAPAHLEHGCAVRIRTGLVIEHRLSAAVLSLFLAPNP